MTQDKGKPEMGPVDVVLYGFFLCLHYPLRATIATVKTSRAAVETTVKTSKAAVETTVKTSKAALETTVRTSKAAVVTTVSLPKRSLNFALSTAASIKHGIEQRIFDTTSFVRNTVYGVYDDTTSFIRNTVDSVFSLVTGTKRRSTNLVRNTANGAVNAVRTSSSFAVNTIQNTTHAASSAARSWVTAVVEFPLVLLGFARSAKAEVNHQFETKIAEPIHQHEKALAETANSITVAAEGRLKKGTNFARNSGRLVWNFLADLTEDPNSVPEPKSQYEKTYARFQAAAFETERQSLKAEILKLNEDVKRGQQKDPERYKCDRQIHDMQDQLTRIHLCYTQQKQQLLTDFEKERQQLQQDIQRLNHQLIKAQVDYEQLTGKQVTGFEEERRQYQAEIQRLLKEIEELKKELGRSEDTNHNENLVEEEEEEEDESNAFQTLDSIKKSMLDVKKRIGEFAGSESDEEYAGINEQITSSLLQLDKVEARDDPVVRKKKKEVLKLVQKCQDELKAKI